MTRKEALQTAAAASCANIEDAARSLRQRLHDNKISKSDFDYLLREIIQDAEYARRCYYP